MSWVIPQSLSPLPSFTTESVYGTLITWMGVPQQPLHMPKHQASIWVKRPLSWSVCFSHSVSVPIPDLETSALFFWICWVQFIPHQNSQVTHFKGVHSCCFSNALMYKKAKTKQDSKFSFWTIRFRRSVRRVHGCVVSLLKCWALLMKRVG